MAVVGGYSVKCEVVGNDDIEINEGFIISRWMLWNYLK